MWSYEKSSSELGEMFNTTLQTLCETYSWSPEVRASIQLATSLLAEAKPERIRLKQSYNEACLQFEFETWENNGSHYSGWYDRPLPANYVTHVEGFDLETKRAYLTFQIALIAGVADDSIQAIRTKLLKDRMDTFAKMESAARKFLKKKLEEINTERKALKALLG